MEKATKLLSSNGRRNGAKISVYIRQALPMLALVTFMVMMLLRPDYYLTSARRGLALFATTVLPSLFPFYFCSLVLTYSGAAEVMAKIGKKPIKLLFNSPPQGAYVLLLSVLSGYPVGASLTAELYERGVFTQKQAEGVAAYASTSGPIFILGTVGSALFDNPSVGAVILAAHYIGAFINGLIYRPRKTAKTYENTPVVTLGYSGAMSDVISKSTINMLFVGGYIVLCGMLIDTLELVGLPSLLTSAFGADRAQPILSILYGAIEMTRSCMQAAQCVDIKLACALACAAVSFGGLSVCLQSYTFLSRCNMPLYKILMRKVTHSAISFCIAYLLAFALT